MIRASLVWLSVVSLGLVARGDDAEEFEKSTPPVFLMVSEIDVKDDVIVLLRRVERPVLETFNVEVVKNGKKEVEEKTVERKVIEMTAMREPLSDYTLSTPKGDPVSDPKTITGLQGRVVVLAPPQDEGGLNKIYRQMLSKDAVVLTPRKKKESE